VAQLLLFAKAEWLAGYCYGPRYLTDMLPALAWILAPALPSLAGRRRLGLCVLIAWSIAVQAIGAFRYPRGHSDQVLYSSAAAPWRPSNAQFLLELRDAEAAEDRAPSVARAPAAH
jgi:hypothetical protein